MDYQFPQELFPSFFKCGPPDLVLKHSGGNWGCYDQVKPEGGSGPLSSWTFTSKHQVRGETWRHTEPVPVPLLSPKNHYLWPSKPPDPQDFTEHMRNFFMDHGHDAFGCMSEILDANFNFTRGKKEMYRKDSVSMWKVRDSMDLLKYNICQQTRRSKTLEAYCTLLSDIVHDIPPELLGSLLHEELTEQRESMLFSEGATGGALNYIPFSQSDSSSRSQHGCLIYPGNQGLDRLNFHRVELQHQRGISSCVDATSSHPFSFKLKGRVRQISSASLLDDCCVAVRSDHLCGVWRLNQSSEPRLLQVINTREVATCVSVSPHVLGEVLVANESGAANLWSVGKGIQKVREEDSNLYFNAKSTWRWCEFSAHPRVMLYADRTGVELSDIRVSPTSTHTLFRISNTSKCRNGERLILSKYLEDVNPFHHLITTQYSAYIMDERCPCVPMLKWDHLMQSPPMFCHVVPGSASSGSAAAMSGTAKVLLGSQSSQEITMLQYSGGRAEACSSRGPPQALLRPRDSLRHLPMQLPHRLETATNRLSSPAAGLTCIQKRGGGGGEEECICVLQLTEAGDIFYQVLEPEQSDTSRNPAADDESASQQPPLSQAALTDSQTVASDTSSDEGIIGPTQGLSMQRFVPETQNVYSDTSADDSEAERKRRRLKKLNLEVVVNDDPELDEGSGSDAGVKDGQIRTANADGAVEERVNGSSSLSHVVPTKQQTPEELSDTTLITWKHWLQKVIHKSHQKNPYPRHLPHFSIPTEDVLQPSKNAETDRTEEKRVQRVRRDLRGCMSNRSLLVNDTVSASARPEETVPIPDPVDTGLWADPLSQRLTTAWQGDEAWRAWWVEKLGLNREEKVQALKRKRRREKEARRASGQSLVLSGSFTSSVSYQSELDYFSESTGWSSEASQRGLSDSEGMGPSQLKSFMEQETEIAETPNAVQTDTPGPTPTATPQKTKEKQSDQQTPRTPSLSQTLPPESTPASQKRRRRPAEDYLSSLFAPQDHPSQHDGHFLDEGGVTQPTAQLVASLPSHQPRSAQRSVRVDLSQDSWSGFSQSLPVSQSSQGRPGLSQASQAKKKKSRMGF
ncbi:TATA box-binding protein-associated factor RNA polymerase I subunit C [Scomber scombrus]|uniref:TATA box-binding protein-associated factor RNA polymerase I subunit C n=1 Tax=Scomber scombrus TaxID=13677 RepID=A0AAV1Q1E3_SCOSC